MKTTTHLHAAALASSSIASMTASRARMLAVLAASVALTAPIASHALDRTPMDACIDAFVASSLPKEQPVRVRKQTMTQSPVDAFGRIYLISMSATGATTGKRYGKATCRVTRGGQVIALNARPAPAYANAHAPTAQKTAAR